MKIVCPKCGYQLQRADIEPANRAYSDQVYWQARRAHAIWLRDNHGLSYEKIGKRLGVTGVAASRLCFFGDATQ